LRPGWSTFSRRRRRGRRKLIEYFQILRLGAESIDLPRARGHARVRAGAALIKTAAGRNVMKYRSNIIRMGVTKVVLSVVLPVFIGSGIALVLNDAMTLAFWIARLCFIAAATDVLGLTVYCLWTGNSHVSSRLIIGAVVGVIVIPALVVALQWVDVREARNSTKLMAGKTPTPALPTQARVPQDALMVFLGSTIAWATRMPHTVVEMGSDKMLVIDNDKSGNRLVVTVLKIFDAGNNIVARIDEQGFWVANSIRIKRVDPSTLVVFDHGDMEVLRITFLNPRALSITGVFRHAGLRTVSITPEFLDIGGMRIVQSSLGESGSADISVGVNRRRKAIRESDD
jgi:hypothetical protein